MSYYEHVFIARPEVAPQQVENVVEDIKKIVSNEGGKTIYTEYWGLRRLAYKINKSEKGHYSLLRIDGNNDTIKEIERVQKLNEDILRYITIKTSEISDEPSVMLKSSEKKDVY
ncbi:MAG: 30S ribosomal protein S6 [Pseudomonadota bacterium]|nr:30S ribosomal protein S6 [Pseudomonadota bacterium]MEC7830608.1 30S ribosomal protein S6 [Pseudomonadota bacterium]MEC9382576.1 30S ribosomal protein S6 [Pseudomonadota bacterium]MEC9481332.1 30S ribosomal protein S6 [Pseudomonadota bacterium]